MSSLRSLLDVADAGDLPVTTFYGPRNSHQYIYRGGHPGYWEYGSSHNYYWHEISWCAPCSCVCKIQWELWGGGGSGNGACCCKGGFDGMAGQYTKCTICAKNNSNSFDDSGNGHPYSLDGCCWRLYVASHTCRGPSDGGNFDGCKTYISGPIMDNFCACGGCHGHACWYWGGSGGGRAGCKGMQYNCQNSSACHRWQTHCYCATEDCRKCCREMGKDFWGNVGSYAQGDCDDCGNWCMHKNISPMPAGLDSSMGTLHVRRNRQMHTCGREESGWYQAYNGGISASCFGHGPPGSGGFGAHVFGGGCCCGSEGGSGMIKITLFCKGG